MSRVLTHELQAKFSKPAPWSSWVHRFFLVLTALQFGLVCCHGWMPQVAAGHFGWLEELLISLAAVTVFTGLARQLPLQNVVLALVTTTLVALFALLLFSSNLFPWHNLPWMIGGSFFGFSAWSIALGWFIAVVASRYTARLISYSLPPGLSIGFWRMAISTALLVLFLLSSTIFRMNTENGGPLMYASLRTLFLFAFVAETIFGIVTLILLIPALLNKRPTREKVERDWLLLWLLPGLLGLVVLLEKHNWIAVGGMALVHSVVTWLALRGAKLAEGPRDPGID